MAVDFGDKHEFGALVESSSGPCVFGTMGTAVFRSSEYPRIQIWHLSNGRDFIMVTHICPTEPDPVEISEVQEIVRTLTIGKNQSGSVGDLSCCYLATVSPKWWRDIRINSIAGSRSVSRRTMNVT